MEVGLARGEEEGDDAILDFLKTNYLILQKNYYVYKSPLAKDFSLIGITSTFKMVFILYVCMQKK